MRFRKFLFIKKLLVFYALISLVTGCHEEESPIETPNNKPQILELYTSADSLLINSTAQFKCLAKDLDNDSLKIVWKTKRGSFPKGNTGKSVTYKSPSISGIDSVTVVVDDGKEKIERTIELFVGDLPTPPKLREPQNRKSEIELFARLLWSKVKDAISHDLEVATDKTFKNFVYRRYSLKNNFHELKNLFIATNYYWRVRSINAFGVSNWSEVYSFRTVSPPEKPFQLIPENEAKNVDINSALRWNKVVNAGSYSIQISESESFDSILINKSGLIDTFYQPSELKNFTRYYWRVSAENLYGESGWSTVQSFETVGTSPAIPNLQSPDNGDLNIPLTVLLNWGESRFAKNYSVQIAEDSLFNKKIIDSTVISSNSLQLTCLKNTQKYFWRVKAVNDYGMSEWSGTYSFVTKLTEPDLFYPYDNSIDVSPGTKLIWERIDEAENYSIEISFDSTFSEIYYSEDGIKDTTIQVSGLATFTKYYWRVRSENQITKSGWSPARSFNVSGYFYKGYDYGNQAIYHPLYVLLSGGFDMIQVGDKRDIKNFPYKTASTNIWRNLSNPFKPINNYGWWNFIKDQVLPLSLNKKNAQFFPNYSLHLIGGGMEYAALKEWFEYNNYSGAGWLSAATVMAYHLVNEIAENGNYIGEDVDPIADIYIFDIGGILLFTSESVKRFFAEDLNLADWSQQPSFSIRNGELHNNGQFFSIRWKFPFLDSWYAFYYFGTNGVGGLSYKFKDGSGISVGFGLRASDLILLDEKTNKKTLGLVGNLGVFYDKNNSLLASLSVTIKTDYMVNLNIYPGIIKFDNVSPGIWGAYGQNGNVILGFTFSWLPFGFANNIK